MRSHSCLSGAHTPLSPATDDEKNPLLSVQPIRKPLIAPHAPIDTRKRIKSHLYDLETVAGQTYILTAN